MLSKIFEWTKGRHTAFAIYFALIGSVLQWFHRLDATFIAFMTSLMGFVLGHSIQENKYLPGQNGQNGQNGGPNVPTK